MAPHPSATGSGKPVVPGFGEAVLPLVIVIAMIGLGPWAALLVLIYPLQWLRLFLRNGSAHSSTFLLIGKFAEVYGATKFHISRLRGVAGTIIEYK